MNNADKLAEIIVQNIGQVAQANRDNPAAFFAWFSGGIIANVVGNLSPQFWEKAMDIRPCGQIGCDCEHHVKKTMALFELIRNDFLEHCVKHAVEE